jgi:molybdopterin converting factor small subunit
MMNASRVVRSHLHAARRAPGSLGSVVGSDLIHDIRVAIPRELRELCGGRTELLLRARDVRGVLAELNRLHPEVHVRLCDERGSTRPHINVFINDQLCARAKFDQPLQAGEVVTILPAVSGG